MANGFMGDYGPGMLAQGIQRSQARRQNLLGQIGQQGQDVLQSPGQTINPQAMATLLNQQQPTPTGPEPTGGTPPGFGLGQPLVTGAPGAAEFAGGPGMGAGGPGAFLQDPRMQAMVRALMGRFGGAGPGM